MIRNELTGSCIESCLPILYILLSWMGRKEWSTLMLNDQRFLEFISLWKPGGWSLRTVVRMTLISLATSNLLYTCVKFYLNTASTILYFSTIALNRTRVAIIRNCILFERLRYVLSKTLHIITFESKFSPWYEMWILRYNFEIS